MNTITGEDGQRHIMSVPITLSVSDQVKESLKDATRIVLKSSVSEDALAVIEGVEWFPNRKEEISTKTFGTRSVLHPKIAKMETEGDWLVSGESMRFLQRVKFNDGLDHYRLTPTEINKIAVERGADALYAF